MGRRLVDLASDKQLRQQMGTAARNRILALADIHSEIGILDEVIGHLEYGKELSRVRSRNERLINFSQRFADLERETSEHLLHHPIDFAAASVYAMYRSARSSARASINRIKLVACQKSP
jgi:hypothetical protein